MLFIWENRNINNLMPFFFPSNAILSWSAGIYVLIAAFIRYHFIICSLKNDVQKIFRFWAVCIMDNLCLTFYSLSELQLKSNLPTRKLKLLVDTQFISLPSWDILPVSWYKINQINVTLKPLLKCYPF